MTDKKLETIQGQTKKRTPKKREPKPQGDEESRDKKRQNIDPKLLKKFLLSGNDL